MTVKRFRLFLIFLLWISLFAVGSAGAVVEISTVTNGIISFEARDSTIAEIVNKFYDKYSIEIKGLENREREKITFSYKADTPEDLLKRLLRHIGIKNYAFEFSDATLERLVVVPEATSDVFSLSQSPKVPSQQNEFVSIAQIQSIVEASQAESAGLQEGDIILEYDGVPISSAQQLVSEVEKKAQISQVELVIVRQKILTRLILSGGFIGVRILTQKIPRAEFNALQ
jgi:C-terminal processing protease CtpA/Prc